MHYVTIRNMLSSIASILETISNLFLWIIRLTITIGGVFVQMLRDTIEIVYMCLKFVHTFFAILFEEIMYFLNDVFHIVKWYVEAVFKMTESMINLFNGFYNCIENLNNESIRNVKKACENWDHAWDLIMDVFGNSYKLIGNMVWFLVMLVQQKFTFILRCSYSFIISLCEIIEKLLIRLYMNALSKIVELLRKTSVETFYGFITGLIIFSIILLSRHVLYRIVLYALKRVLRLLMVDFIEAVSFLRHIFTINRQQYQRQEEYEQPMQQFDESPQVQVHEQSQRPDQPQSPVSRESILLALAFGRSIETNLSPFRISDTSNTESIKSNTSSTSNLEHNCVICQDRPRSVVLFPCRHLCLCDKCSVQSHRYGNKCPLCRLNIYRAVNVYV